MQLGNKRALVTGGSRGIGRAIVQALAKEGADVAFTFERSSERAREVEASVALLGRKCIALQADSASAPAVQTSVQRAAEALGGLDILINNAGIYRGGAIEDLRIEDLDALLAVNVRSVVLAVQEAFKFLPDGGRIVNIGSCLADRVAWPGSAAYAMTKSALNGLTRGLARDFGPRGITVNTVHPGPTITDMTSEEGDFSTMMREHVALKTFSTAEQIGTAVVYLVSPSAKNVTGTSLVLDGGLNA